MPDKRLVIVGEGNIKEDLKERKISSNISFLGWLKDNELICLYQQAKAFVYAAEEDFGITPLEAQACGLPVIAYGKGGALETVIPFGGASQDLPASGIFFQKQDSTSLIAAIEEFEKKKEEFNPEQIRNNSLRFSRQTFREKIKNKIKEEIGSI
jgi:glycosyltransferase involved in cell wall biosynthesis